MAFNNMHRHKSLTDKRSAYYSPQTASTTKLPSKAALDRQEYKPSWSMTTELTAMLHKHKTSASARALRSSQRKVPSISGNSTPRNDIKVGSYSTKASSLRSGSTGTPKSRSGGVFPFEGEADTPKPATAWMQKTPRAYESAAQGKLKRISRPGTSRQQPPQQDLRAPPQQDLRTSKSQPLLQERRDREAAALANVLFKKPSRLEEKPAPSKLNSLVTKVAQSLPQPVLREALSQEEQQARSERIYREHLFQTFQALKCVRTLPPPDPSELNQKRVVLTRRRGYEDRKTMIFDLDETLVHCNDDLQTSDVVLEVRFPTGELINVRCR
jgi:hypothetical protein